MAADKATIEDRIQAAMGDPAERPLVLFEGSPYAFTLTLNELREINDKFKAEDYIDTYLEDLDNGAPFNG